MLKARRSLTSFPMIPSHNLERSLRGPAPHPAACGGRPLHEGRALQQLLQLGGEGLAEVRGLKRVRHVGEQEAELRAAVEASALMAVRIKGLRLGAEVRQVPGGDTTDTITARSPAGLRLMMT